MSTLYPRRVLPTLPWTLPLMAMALMGVEECSSDPDPDGAIEAHACIHFAEGPFEALTAATTAATAPLLAEHHTVYQVALTSFQGQRGGWVTFAPDADGDHFLFADSFEPLDLYDGAMTPVIFEDVREGSTECDEIQGRWVAHLHMADGPFYVEIGPTSATSIGLLVEEGEAH